MQQQQQQQERCAVFVARVRSLGSVLGITIPVEVVKKLQLKPGDYIKVTVEKIT